MMVLSAGYWAPKVHVLCLDTTASWLPLSRNAFSLRHKEMR